MSYSPRKRWNDLALDHTSGTRPITDLTCALAWHLNRKAAHMNWLTITATAYLASCALALTAALIDHTRK